MPVLGCDNVHWGGIDIAVVPPPPQVVSDETGEVQLPPTAERLPEGPILYYVRPQDGTATMVPVGEIDGDSLRPIRAANDWESFGNRFIAEHLREGSEFTLFLAGARAGTFIVQGAQLPAGGGCARLPRATGILERTAAAANATEFLAMSRLQAPNVAYQPAAPTEADGGMRRVAPILAERIMRSRGAPLPNDWGRSTAQIRPFPADERGATGFAATFLVGDVLEQGQDDVGHATFFIATPAPIIGYDTVYVRFVDYAREGKAAPRVVDFLDWDRDGESSLLLQVFGTNETWFEAIGRTGGQWRRIFQDRCAQPPPAVMGAAPDTAALAPAAP